MLSNSMGVLQKDWGVNSLSLFSNKLIAILDFSEDGLLIIQDVGLHKNKCHIPKISTFYKLRAILTEI